MNIVKYAVSAALSLTLAAFFCPMNVCAADNTYIRSPLTEETKSFYDNWKSRYLAENTYVTNEQQYYIWYSGENYSQNNSETAVTVSEAHGYGMLITACMADYDSSAKEIFDGMYRFYLAHPSSIGPHLMAWQQNDTGSSIDDAAGADSASDGDMDIAYSLLMADSIWGSEGEINYKQAAADIINDIMEYEVNKTDWIIQLGDWVYTSGEDDKYYAAARSSDFIMQYMPIFASVTGDTRWMKVYESTYSIINEFTAGYNTGLLPDFIVKDSLSGKFIPAPADFLESEYDGCYYYNSCRTPWRIGMDYLINKNENALAFSETLNSFITDSTGRNPWEIKAGYKPDGTPFEDYNDLCFTAPFLICAGCSGSSKWHDDLRDVILNYGDDVYFGDTIKMLCLISDDGGWIVPETDNAIKGDVNSDGSFDISDIIIMQKCLIFAGSLSDYEAGDINCDNIINICDLALMKNMLKTQTL